VTSADPLPDPKSTRPDPRPAVAKVNLGLLALIAGASLVYRLVSDVAVYWPTAAFAVWCVVVHVALRRRPPPRARRQRRQRLENAAIGMLSAFVLVGTVALSLSKLLAL